MADDATIEVLQLLRDNGNVLLTGPPATGKSRLLALVAQAFQIAATPAHAPGTSNPFPAGAHVAGAPEWLPSPNCTNREVFETAFHPGYKYRDLMRGLAPAVGQAAGFVVIDGILYKAAVFSAAPDSASLLIIDEINRGPAVQIFGDCIVALDLDKREGQSSVQSFQLLQDDGTLDAFTLPRDLYILGAMNKADTSVEPLDVAFLRRWAEYPVEPDETILLEHFGLEDSDFPAPDDPTEAAHVYAAAVAAWRRVNDRICVGRSSDFQLGHGIFFPPGVDKPPDDLAEAKALVRSVWKKLRTHLDEVFFGNTRGIGAVLNVGAPGHPIEEEERSFGGERVTVLRGETDADMHALLRAVASDDVE